MVQRGGRVWARAAELESTRLTTWLWFESPARGSPAARSVLADGVAVELYVEVAQQAAETNDELVAVASFVLGLPLLEALQSREATHRYVRDMGSWVWHHRPDPSGVIHAASDALTRQVAEASAALEAETRRAEEAMSATRAQAAAERRHVEEQASGRLSEYMTSLLQCTPQRAGAASLILYRLRNGTSWLVYMLIDGGAGLVQWPVGQAEALVPPSDVKTFDDKLGVYRTTANQAIMFLRLQAAVVHNDSDPKSLARWAADNLAVR